MKKEVFQKLYSILIALLALTSITLAALDLLGRISLTKQPFAAIDTAILLVFTADYSDRIGRSGGTREAVADREDHHKK